MQSDIFAMVKQESDNRRIEQSNLSLKRPQFCQTGKTLVVIYKIVVAEVGKLSKLIS